MTEDKALGLWSRLVKALSPDQVRHPGGPSFFLGSIPRTKIDFDREVGSLTRSSVVMAPIMWVQRAIPEARFRVVKDVEGGVEEVENHPLTAIINHPNESYTETTLIAGAVLDYLTRGNGFWHAVRNGAGKIVEFWYAPAMTMTPKFPRDGTTFISHWEYKPGQGQTQKLEIEDVVHFRHGVDPNNLRLGLSPLDSVVREIFVDLEASNFTATYLKNNGVPGLVIAPKNDTQMTPDETAATKTWIREQFTGDRRGEPLIMGMPTSVTEFGYSPDKMALAAVRNVAEERVSAALGIPAAVVGFGSGMEQTKVGATMAELRKLAWINGVLPMLKVFAEEIGRIGLTDQERAKGLRGDFDTGDVVALQDDEKMLADRWAVMVKGAWATRGEARRAVGLETDDSDEVYLVPFSTFEVPRGSSPRVFSSPDDGATAPKRLKGHAASQAGLRYVRQLDQMQPKLAALMERKLAKVFADMGKAAEKAARAALKGAGALGSKLDAADQATLKRILKAMNIPVHKNAFKEVYESFYLTVAEEVAGAGETVGLGVNLTDPVARSVVAAGGKRAGLVDLSKQTKDALFDTLTEGRADGLGADALARKIRDNISAGPWRTPAIRAKVIARTETKFAQNVSTLERSKDAGVTKFVIHDGRLGEEVAATDGSGWPEGPESHFDRDGLIVDADIAENMAAAEHPNGTLSFSPHFEDDDST